MAQKKANASKKLVVKGLPTVSEYRQKKAIVNPVSQSQKASANALNQGMAQYEQMILKKAEPLVKGLTVFLVIMTALLVFGIAYKLVGLASDSVQLKATVAIFLASFVGVFGFAKRQALVNRWLNASKKHLMQKMMQKMGVSN